MSALRETTGEQSSVKKQRLRLTFTRNEVCWLLDALETIVEDLKYDGGLVLAEDYMTLRERLTTVLHDFDRNGKRRAS